MAQTAPLRDEIDAVPGPAKADRWAWGLCWLLFASTVLNYMDRQAIALVSPQIKGEFGLANAGFGWVLAAFYLTYALCQVPAGYLADRWDVRRTYAGAVAWWSLAGIAAAFAPGVGALMMLRALLGVGESFNWPCALKVTGTVLPPADRSLGNGIFNSGAAVGAVLTPLIVPPLALAFGWRVAFVVIGALGFAWLAAWLLVLAGGRGAAFGGRKGEARPAGGVPATALAAFGAVALIALLIAVLGYRQFRLAAIWWGIATLMIGPLLVALVLPRSALAGADWSESLGDVVRLPRFWVLVAVSVSINVCWHFLVGWLPTYLKEDRGMTYLASGLLSALPFLAADAGNLGGGALSRTLARRGWEPSRARMAVMAGCTLLVSTGALVGAVRSDALVLTLLGLMALGAAAFMANYFAFCQDVAPRHTGLIVGILGGLGNLFAAGFAPIAGAVRDQTGGFGPVFVVVGLLPIVGLTTLLLAWRTPRADADATA